MTEKGQLRLHDISISGGERSSLASINVVNKNTTRNLNENINRVVDQLRDSDTQRLTAAERARLLTDIDALQATQNAKYESDRDLMKGQAADDRVWSLDLQEKMLVRTNERLAWATTEIDNRIAAQYDALSRTAGSSHNCFVQYVGLETQRDAVNQRASILADMDLRALQAETEARDRAFREGVTARLDSNDRLVQHKNTEWGLLKDALMVHHETQNTKDVTDRTLAETINELTTATQFQLSGRGYAEDRVDSSGAYAGQASSYAADVSAFP
jgi:hypothetical protein